MNDDLSDIVKKNIKIGAIEIGAVTAVTVAAYVYGPEIKEFVNDVARSFMTSESGAGVRLYLSSAAIAVVGTGGVVAAYDGINRLIHPRKYYQSKKENKLPAVL